MILKSKAINTANHDTTRHTICSSMANFWDLPQPVREQIYRLHLVQEDPVDLKDFDVACGNRISIWPESHRKVPQLLQVCKKTEREAAEIYFGENTFIWKRPHDVYQWKYRLWPRHLRLIRALIVGGWTNPEHYGGGYNECFRLLSSFRGLRVLTLKVDEQMALESKLRHHPTIKWHRSLGCSPQLQLQVLHFCGLQGLRSLTNFPRIDFPPSTDEGRKRHGDSGAIKGGILDTLVRREIARSPEFQSYKRKGQFPFLALPPEIRNNIYALLLVFPGVTYPKVDKPTSAACIDKHTTITAPIPCSALSILQTNRQIHNEAVGMFYRQNDLVFSYPAHLQDFVQSLERDRLESVSSLTLFHKNHNEGGISTMATTLKLIRRLRGLKKFHLLMEHQLVASPSWSSQTRERCVSRIHGIAILFTLRGIADIKVRDLDLEDRMHKVGSYANRDVNDTVKDLVQVLKHFNHGLALAQKGIVVEELCEEFWWAQGEWPSLGESVCGKSVGCVCGEASVAKEKPDSD